MKLLLDTHVVLWAFADPDKLSTKATKAIVDGRNMVFVSAVTAWEITIKRALGKLKAPDDYEEQVRNKQFTQLDITTQHALATGTLAPVHKDPFDRLLIAQALTEHMIVVTRDSIMREYGVQTIAA